ncbi:uncharacterized protein LOC116288366 [Actinia tenebrosa]|uniref:Uncharacterized protein LOC116288366 n=1 Tax=Actinia tenebrosa TaxID=6105 RepID=A0A6P8H6M1_ACTTE|nr:uncharacterized protein LOC116288366 [Actinia tenebrosa]
MRFHRIVVRNLDLLYRIPGFLFLAVISDYLTKVAGKILSSELKRESFSKNSENEDRNNTIVIGGDTESNFHVPHASIILLSLLALCLIVLFIMYIMLRRCESRLMDQLSGKGRSFSYTQIDSPESGLDSGKLSEKDYALYPLSTTIEKPLKEDVNRNPPPLRAAVIQVTVSFLSTTGRLVIEIERLKSVTKTLLRSGFATSVEIHARLLPLSDKFRYKTSSKPIPKAEFHERFAFDGFTKDDLRKCWLRFRLYSQRRMGKSKLLGQVNVGITDFEVDGVWSTLNLDILPSEEVHKLLTMDK